MIKEKVRKTIIKEKLIREGDKILIGLSGGADSVTLTHILWSLKDELNFEITAAHLNHNIRGEEALRDAEFSKAFAKSLGIKFIMGSADVIAFAKEKGISEEMAGRELRYAFFEDVCEGLGLDKIATAHNKNDRAETVTMNFIRGTSLKGLCGIPYKRDSIIRPLLDVTRSEIEEYCKEQGLKYVTDSTNLTDDYTRNKVRNEVIPLIEKEFNPNFINTVVKNADLIKSEAEYIEAEAKKQYMALVKNRGVEIKSLLKLHCAMQRRVVRMMISDVMGLTDISSDFCDDIIKLAKINRSGMSINLPNDTVARVEYGILVVDKAFKCSDYEYDLPLGEDVYIKEADITIRAEEATEKVNDKAKYFSNVDGCLIKVRNRRNGDVFYPAGMQGKKKLKDYFIDKKIPRNERSINPIITFDGEIGYIVGRRSDRRYEFTGKGIKITIK